MTASDLKQRLPAVDIIAGDLYGIRFTKGAAHCPFPGNHNHGDRDRSLRHDQAKDRIFCASQHCFGEKGADAFGLVQVMDHVEFKEAADKLATRYGVNGTNRNGQSAATSRPQAPLKTAAFVREARARDGWVYHSHCDFGDFLRKVRFQHRTRMQEGKGKPDKDFVWEHRVGDEWFSGAGGITPPIFFNATAREQCGRGSLLLVEGPDKANAADALGIAAASLKELGDTNVVQLAGSKVVIWPDNDAAGRKLAANAAERLGKHGAEVSMIDPPPELPEGGDIIDAIALGWDRERILGLMEGATRLTERPFTVDDIRPTTEYGNVEIKYVFRGVIAERTVNVISGEPGCGKSSLASFIAATAAQERDVLYCDRENNLPVVAERHARMGIVDGGKFKYMGLWCGVEPWAPDSPELIAWVKQCDPKPLLIFDSVSAYFDGDENSATDMRAFMESFRRLTALGATVLLLHHSGKGENTKDYRGSSDLKASIDSGWHLSNFGEGRLERLRLRAWKCRYAIASDILMDYAGGRFLRDERSDAPARSFSDQLTSLLRQNPGLTQTAFEAITTRAGIARAITRSFLRNGVSAKTIVEEPGAKRAMHYSLAMGENHAQF
jgi:AAA domain/Toprim domain